MNKINIRYANCYEDTTSLLETARGKTYLSICSGLDNTLALLLNKPDLIYAFDYNIVQIYLAQLKMTAIKNLEYEEILTFMGISGKAKQRLKIYQKLSPSLTSDTRQYFNQNIHIIKKGLIYGGKFEKYLQMFKKYILPFTHHQKTIQKFMMAPTIEEQRTIYQNNFNNKRFQKLFDFFFSQKVMSKFGRERSYFSYIDDNLSEKLKKRVDLGFEHVLNKDNPYIQYIILGRFISLPIYLQPQNFKYLKQHVDKIILIKGDLHNVKELNVKFDFLNLSDIFEYMSEEETKDSEKILEEITNSEGRIIFWNMMVHRQLKKECFKELDSEELFIQEKPFFYQRLWRYEKQ